MTQNTKQHASGIQDFRIPNQQADNISHLFDDQSLESVNHVFLRLRSMNIKIDETFGSKILSILKPIKRQLDWVEDYSNKHKVKDTSELWPTEIVTELYTNKFHLPTKDSLEHISTDHDMWSLYASLSIAICGTQRLQYYVRLLVLRHICKTWPETDSTYKSEENHKNLMGIIICVLREDKFFRNFHKWICAEALKRPIYDCMLDERTNTCSSKLYSDNNTRDKEIVPIYLFTCKSHVLPLIPKPNKHRHVFRRDKSLVYSSTDTVNVLDLLNKYINKNIDARDQTYFILNVAPLTMTGKPKECSTCALSARKIKDAKQTYADLTKSGDLAEEIKQLNLRHSSLVSDCQNLNIKCNDFIKKIKYQKNFIKNSKSASKNISTDTAQNQEPNQMLEHALTKQINSTRADKLDTEPHIKSRPAAEQLMTRNDILVVDETLNSGVHGAATKQVNCSNNMNPPLDTVVHDDDDDDDFISVDEDEETTTAVVKQRVQVLYKTNGLLKDKDPILNNPINPAKNTLNMEIEPMDVESEPMQHMNDSTEVSSEEMDITTETMELGVERLKVVKESRQLQNEGLNVAQKQMGMSTNKTLVENSLQMVTHSTYLEGTQNKPGTYTTEPKETTNEHIEPLTSVSENLCAQYDSPIPCQDSMDFVSSSNSDSESDAPVVREHFDPPRENRDPDHPLISEVVAFKCQGKVQKVLFPNLVDNKHEPPQPPTKKKTLKARNRELYKCVFCARHKETLDKLKDHILSKHDKKSDSSNPVFQRVIPKPNDNHRKRSLSNVNVVSKKTKHQISEGDDPIVASNLFRKSKQTAKRKIASLDEYSTDPEFRCEYCGKTEFSNKSVFNRHVNGHVHKNRFPCPHCKYSCPRRDNLKTHIERRHMRHRNFPCPKCDQVFHGLQTYSNHYSSKHFEFAIVFGEAPPPQKRSSRAKSISIHDTDGSVNM